jgi:NAD(P)-dependent dehydrogenase (short-subunit alcohol dehydrogenase family)
MLATDLSGKKALVTGAGRGLGRSIAETLAGEGVSVAIADIDADVAAQTSNEVTAAGGTAMSVGMDVTDRNSVTQGVGALINAWRHIDILVNNAGVTGAPGWIEADDDRDEDWESCFRVNLVGMMYCCKAVLPHMQTRNYGKIINISSMSARPVSEKPEDALLGRPSHFPYAVTKAGVIRYTQKLAPLAAAHNINVNTVCPGSMLTDFGMDIVRRQQHVNDESAIGSPGDVRRQMVINSNLFKRELTPEDVAKMVVFLGSDDARNITGATFHVDGGAVMA